MTYPNGWLSISDQQSPSRQPREKQIPAEDRIIAVGLLSAADLRILGDDFSRCFLVEAASSSDKLLHVIDLADRDMMAARHAVETAYLIRNGPAQ